MKEPYKGNTDSANRLHAARRAAGFKSTRDAAIRFGWQPGLYSAHETAQRHFDVETGRVYADAFGVSLAWLMEGRGQGPATDQMREARFKLRKQLANAPTRAAAGRLRVARRLAGYRSLSNAARAIGVNQSTLSAHENGQDDLSRGAAIYYAKAYGVDVKWLLSGRLPSGFGEQTEARLGVLLSLHDEPENRALPHFRGLQREVPVPRKPMRKGAQAPRKAIPHGDLVPEYTPLALYRRLANLKKGSNASGEWSFPSGYLSEILGCDATTAAVLSITKTVHEGSGPMVARAGSRLVLDTGTVSPLPNSYCAVVRADGDLLILRRSKEGRELEQLGPDEKVAGTICGFLDAIRSPC